MHLLLALSLLTAPQVTEPEHPNVILLMADDLGYGDTGFTGNEVVRTPHLDRLVGEGVRLDRFYAAAPVCSPTRASCLTGRHPFRSGITWAFAGALPAREWTIAEALSGAGYATAHLGKWHVGELSPSVKQGYAPGDPDPLRFGPPWEHGFETCFSILNTVPTFNPYYLTCGGFGSDGYRMVMDRPVALGQRDGGFVWRDRFWTGPGRMVDEWLEGPVPDLLVDRALEHASRAVHDRRPFLSLVWFSTPHTPVVAGPEHRALYPDLSIQEQHWYGSISAMDDAVGRLVAGLEQLGVADDTLLIFCSDNGPTWVHEFGTTGGLRGRKGSLHEGGIRVPAFARWPNGLPGGAAVRTPMSTSDLMPTALAAARIEPPLHVEFDGEDLLPILRGERDARSRALGFASPTLESSARDTRAWMQTGGLQFAWIDGNEKLVSTNGGETWQLYDLDADPGETRDLASERPQRTAALRSELEDWHGRVDASARGEDPVPVLVAGTTAVAGVPTSPSVYAQFREQAVVVTRNGRIVVTAQARERSSWKDRSGQDLVCTWSDDSGDTWSEPVLVAEFGDHSICPNAAVFDRETDTIHVLYNVFRWNFHDAESRKSMRGRECRQFHQSSADGGATWSAPRELTAELASDERVTVFGSGEGIQLEHGPHSGRLVVPGGFAHLWGNRMFLSDDHGETWRVGDIAPRDRVKQLNVRLENKVAELSNGTLVLNARHTPERVRAFSSDGGESWTAEEVDPGLPAVSCNGSILRVRDDVLLCSVPTGPGRTHGAVYASRDGGWTWPMRSVLVEGAFAYSSLVQLADGRIGLFYEARDHKDILFRRYPLARLLPAPDRFVFVGEGRAEDINQCGKYFGKISSAPDGLVYERGVTSCCLLGGRKLVSGPFRLELNFKAEGTCRFLMGAPHFEDFRLNFKNRIDLDEGRMIGRGALEFQGSPAIPEDIRLVAVSDGQELTLSVNETELVRSRDASLLANAYFGLEPSSESKLTVSHFELTAGRTQDVLPQALRPLPRSDEHFLAVHAAASQATDCDVLFLGDSITDAFDGAAPFIKGENHGKRVWDEFYGDLDAVNAGVGSDRTSQLLWRLRNMPLETVRPKAVVLLIGINNVSSHHPPELIVGGIRACIAEVERRSPKTRVLLLTVLPTRRKALEPPRHAVNEGLAATNWGPRVELIDMDAAFLDEEGWLRSEATYDGVHLSPAGFRIWAEVIDESLRDVIGER